MLVTDLEYRYTLQMFLHILGKSQCFESGVRLTGGPTVFLCNEERNVYKLGSIIFRVRVLGVSLMQAQYAVSQKHLLTMKQTLHCNQSHDNICTLYHVSMMTMAAHVETTIV